MKDGVAAGATTQQETLAEMVPQLRLSLEDQNGDVEAEVRRCAGVNESDENPYGKTNVGIVEVSEEDERARVRLRLVSGDEREPPRPRIVFCSGWL